MHELTRLEDTLDVWDEIDRLAKGEYILGFELGGDRRGGNFSRDT